MEYNRQKSQKIASLKNAYYIATRNMIAAKADPNSIAARLQAEDELQKIFAQCHAMGLRVA